MPHFHIEYSANLEVLIDIGQLCETVRAQAEKIDTFPMAGIRVRATRVDYSAVANGDPKHGFIDLSVRLRAGRPQNVKHDAITQVFAALTDFMAPTMETHSVALSAEMRDIDADLSPKLGNIRDHLEDPA
jgi:5-carboxymethyl-2-hydroxymuconate isomerase